MVSDALARQWAMCLQAGSYPANSSNNCLGLLEIGGVKALGEPAVDRRQQLVGLGALALLLPQPTQAHGGPQLQRLRLLAAGHVEGLLQTGFRLCARRARLAAGAAPP